MSSEAIRKDIRMASAWWFVPRSPSNRDPGSAERHVAPRPGHRIGSSANGQAAFFFDFATWAAMASINPGDRQS
jgi:hypothetical protein